MKNLRLAVLAALLYANCVAHTAPEPTTIERGTLEKLTAITGRKSGAEEQKKNKKTLQLLTAIQQDTQKGLLFGGFFGMLTGGAQGFMTAMILRNPAHVAFMPPIGALGGMCDGALRWGAFALLASLVFRCNFEQE